MFSYLLVLVRILYKAIFVFRCFLTEVFDARSLRRHSLKAVGAERRDHKVPGYLLISPTLAIFPTILLPQPGPGPIRCTTTGSSKRGGGGGGERVRSILFIPTIFC